MDPTLIIDKKYYLDLIKNYNDNNQNISNYIFLYGLYRQNANISLLEIPLEINNITLNHEKIESVNYLKKNLNLYKIK